MSAPWAVVLAGGRGARFWPLSRVHRPKQCLALLGGPTLLESTIARLDGLIPRHQILVLTGPDMAEAVRAASGLPEAQILVEPRPRNTAPAVGWAAVEVARRGGPEAVALVLPSDHDVTDPGAWREALDRAARTAAQSGAITVLGVRPDHPETAYGYIEAGEPAPELPGVARVRRFVEKPDAARAVELVEAGLLWNAGVFVFRCDALRAAFRRHLPRSGAALDALEAAPNRLGELWGELDATSLDYGVLEREADLRVVPCAPGWSDLGSWRAASVRWPAVEGGTGLAEAVLAHDAHDNAVYAPGRVVALLGVRGLGVVDTGDALLILDLGRDQDVRALVERLDAPGLRHLR